jgi:putative phage-type endonuclease
MELTQNSLEWLKWRAEGLGASDAPIVMGKSKYKTKLQLWDEKFTKKVDEEENKNTFIQDKGHRLEAWARPGLEFQTGVTWKPALFTHPDFQFLRASVDGWNPELQKVWECKLMGKDLYETLTNESLTVVERIPPQYLDQICQQLFVTGAQSAFLTGIKEYKDENDQRQKVAYTLDIPRDEKLNDYINKELVPALFEFWKSVQEGTKPEPAKVDSLKIEDVELQNLLTEYEGLAETEKEAKANAKKIKDKIVKHKSRNHAKLEFGEFKIVEVPGAEKVDYKAAFEAFIGWIKTVKTLSPGEQVHSVRDFPEEPNLEKYTKAGASSVRITVPKKKKKKEPAPLAPPIKETDAVTKEYVDNTVVAPTKEEVEKAVKPADKLKEWKDMTPEQQTATAASNAFKNPDTDKKIRGWDGKTREERIKFLRDKAKRKTTSDVAREKMLNLANELESLFKEPEKIGGITFEN